MTDSFPYLCGNITEVLAAYRHISLHDIGNATGLSWRTIASWRRGIMPQAKNLATFCDFFGLTVEQVLTWHTRDLMVHVWKNMEFVDV